MGSVSGFAAPMLPAWVASRAAAQVQAASSAELPRDVMLPSRVLDPRRGVVKFIGRDVELRKLLAWCQGSTKPKMLLITGPGGVGKTRLALQLTERLGREWRCQWVGDDQEAMAVARIRAATSRRVLLIVDYAETRVRLRALAHAVAADRGTPTLRLLLLARATGQWWDQLSAGEVAVRDLVTAARHSEIYLNPFLTTGLSDERLFRQAIQAFAENLQVDVQDLANRAQITAQSGRARVLDLHMAALIAVLNSLTEPGRHREPRSRMYLSTGRPQKRLGIFWKTPRKLVGFGDLKAHEKRQVRVCLPGVLDELLQHESRFWQRSAETRGLLAGPAGLTSPALRRIVAAGTLLGAADEAEASEVLGRVPDVLPTEKLALWLRDLYPPEQGSGEWLGTLHPDRLAERHVVDQLEDSEVFAERCLTGLNQRQALVR